MQTLERCGCVVRRRTRRGVLRAPENAGQRGQHLQAGEQRLERCVRVLHVMASKCTSCLTRLVCEHGYLVDGDRR